MAFNYEKYTANNPLLQEIDEEVSVSSSGVEMESDNLQSAEVSKYPRADFADAVYKANRAGLSKEDLLILVRQNAK